MREPLIGISGSIDAEGTQQFTKRAYFQACLRAGGLPVLLSLDMEGEALDACLRRLDGLLLAGGNDVAPALYGEAALPQLGEVNPPRDAFERALVARAMRLDMPVLGICRGIQAMNAFLGGTLYQDLPSQLGQSVDHHPQSPPEQPCHFVDVLPDTLLGGLTGCLRLEVNSTHHQAARVPAPGLRVSARADDGAIEGLESESLAFFLGVQWHPERLADERSDALFSGFIRACARYAEKNGR